jgi:hypothetical protein
MMSGLASTQCIFNWLPLTLPLRSLSSTVVLLLLSLRLCQFHPFLMSFRACCVCWYVAATTQVKSRAIDDCGRVSVCLCTSIHFIRSLFAHILVTFPHPVCVSVRCLCVPHSPHTSGSHSSARVYPLVSKCGSRLTVRVFGNCVFHPLGVCKSTAARRTRCFA